MHTLNLLAVLQNYAGGDDDEDEEMADGDDDMMDDDEFEDEYVKIAIVPYGLDIHPHNDAQPCADTPTTRTLRGKLDDPPLDFFRH
jgi:hypothetical protein